MSTTNSDNSLDEKHTWNILNDCFKKQGFVHMQIDSFNYYINQGIQSVIDDEPNIESIDKQLFEDLGLQFLEKLNIV